MKLRRLGAPREEPEPETGRPSSEQQRVCPQCGSLISAHARTCLHCGADLVTIARAEQQRLKQIQREKREEAALRPTRIIVVVFTAVVVMLILALVVQGSQEAAQRALTPTITRTPTRTPRPTSTPQPTPTSADTPTPIPPIEYVVKSGDTPGLIAEQCGLSVEQLMLYNAKAVDDFIVVGETMKCPAPTPRPAGTVTLVGDQPTATSGPSTCESTYIVQSGDTLSDIAEKLNVSAEMIQQTNGIDDPTTLQIGQQLTINTCPTPTVTPSPTIDVNATPTPVPNYGPVKLLTPLDGEIIIGNAQPILLQWLSSGVLQQNELYRVEVTQVNSGRAPASSRTLATSWRVPLNLYPAPADRNRKFRWKVEIIRQVGTGSDGAPIYEVVSPLSQYSFEWLAEPPTPTPTATPLPSERITPRS
jgi:LysM repeat protein